MKHNGKRIVSRHWTRRMDKLLEQLKYVKKRGKKNEVQQQMLTSVLQNPFCSVNCLLLCLAVLYQQNNLCHRPGQRMLICHSFNLDCTHQAVLSWVNLGDPAYWPLVATAVWILNQDNISHFSVSWCILPFLTLETGEELLPPSGPKYISQILNSSPSLTAINVCLLKVAWWLKNYFWFHGEQIKWAQYVDWFIP